MPVLRIVDSITELGEQDEGFIAVSGSHGGLSSASYALAARPLLGIFNDAGVGLNSAGLAALAFLESHSLAACTVAHHSACIWRSLQHAGQWCGQRCQRRSAGVGHSNGLDLPRSCLFPSMLISF